MIGAGVLLLLALVVVLWARTRPGYDPYGWLVWGNLTIHGKLDTNGAPSWKPLPFLFTVPYALIGHRAMWLWMITSVAVSLSGGVFAARIAYRLTDAPEGFRWAGWIAGAFAVAALFGIDYYTHYILSAQSDTMIVALCLGAIDCHLYRRYKWAFALAMLAALGRPETLPLIGLYSIWLWRKFPSIRPLVAGGIVLLPVMWFGIPGLTSKSLFTAANIAEKSPRALHQNKLFGELDRFIRLTETTVLSAGAARGRSGCVAPRPDDAGDRGRGGAVGDHRGRVRAPRVAWRAALPVRARRRHVCAGRGRDRADPHRRAAARRAASGSRWWPGSPPRS